MISKYQQTSLGMQTYYWHTMVMKEYVVTSGRYSKAIPQHYYIDNMLCSWDNPEVYSDDLGKTWKKDLLLGYKHIQDFRLCADV